MRTNPIFLLLIVFLSAVVQARSQNDTINYSLNIRINGGTGTYAPFLSTANQYDRFSFSPNALNAWGNLHKMPDRNKAVDYTFGMELNGNASTSNQRFFADELYLGGKFHFLNFYAGRKQAIYGNQDEELSSGGMIWSANSRPLFKIALETNDFLPVPGTKGFAEIKGGISHGWFDHSAVRHLLLHHKYGYIRIGGSLPVKLTYGIQHVAQWGGQSPEYGTMPVTWKNYFRILMGQSGSSSANISDQENTLGNHIISQNLGLDMNLKSFDLSLYWQNISEDPSVQFITKAPNIADGLWGLSARIPKFNILSHLVIEYLSTTDQSGPWNELDGVIWGGQDGYYTNGLIPNGWSNQGMTIGNPWITSPKFNKDGSLSTQNNTVRLYYFSGKGKIKAVDYRLTLAYSKNYGFTKPIYPEDKKQFSWQFEVFSPLRLVKNTTLNMAISEDYGSVYGNNLNLILGITYSGFGIF